MKTIHKMSIFVVLIAILALVPNVTATGVMDGSNWTGIDNILDSSGYRFLKNNTGMSNPATANQNMGGYNVTNATNISAKQIGGVIYADQYATIQDAINYSTGQEIYIPAGTYNLGTSKLTITKNNRTLRGAGIGKTVLLSSRNMSIFEGVIEIGTPSNSINNTVIADLSIQMNYSIRQGENAGNGISTAGEIHGLDLVNIETIEGYYGGISINDGTTANKFKNFDVKISGARSINEGLAVALTMCYRCEIKNSYAEGTRDDHWAAGWNSQYITISNNIYNGTYSKTGTQATGSVFNGSTGNIIHIVGDIGIASNIIIENNMNINTSSETGHGITISGEFVGDNIQVLNNQMLATGGHGFYTSGKNETITGNIFETSKDSAFAIRDDATTGWNIYTENRLKNYGNSNNIFSGGVDSKQILVNNYGKSPFNFGNTASAPTAFGAGDSFYNSTANILQMYTGSIWEWFVTSTVSPNNIKDQSINFVISNGSNVIGTGIKGDVEIPFTGTIIKSTALADQTGSVNISWWKDSYANYPPTAVDLLGYQVISTSNKGQSTGLSQAVTAGDILRFNVESADTVTRVTISLTVRRS